ncbi:hypothetical protein LH464_21245 [Neorhizobium sp. T786]|uniref:hypothetical protein n=1 Tax=Pseudorhizobium xiangyangii TaxID=2883104 RepID=UPI001CFFC9C7|nr:hypothetical protein [Neorhizobium xiangyangii]MCB5204995.1 hypothetical protein [Neorhizobium xiangyangii]
MEFSTKDIIALLANKETVVVGFALVFLAWALLERRDRRSAEAEILKTYQILTAVVQKFDDNTAFWRDTIIRLTEKSLGK